MNYELQMNVISFSSTMKTQTKLRVSGIALLSGLNSKKFTKLKITKLGMKYFSQVLENLYISNKYC